MITITIAISQFRRTSPCFIRNGTVLLPIPESTNTDSFPSLPGKGGDGSFFLPSSGLTLSAPLPPKSGGEKRVFLVYSTESLGQSFFWSGEVLSWGTPKTRPFTVSRASNHIPHHAIKASLYWLFADDVNILNDKNL